MELCNGYNHKESATAAGTVLREVLKSDAAAAIILYDDPNEGGFPSKGLSGVQPEMKQSGKGVFWKFFDWIDKGSFEVSADAFTTFRVSFTSIWRRSHAHHVSGAIDEAQTNRCTVLSYQL